MLNISDLTFRMRGRPLLQGASLSVPSGARMALVGRNGTGKSTLLRLIAGELQPDAGSVSLPVGARIGWVRQEAPSGPVSLMDAVLAADGERAALLAEAETATDPTRIADIHARLRDIDAHSAEARAARILFGLGFSAESQARPCSDFSGGWRMRVALAGVLFAAPDLLLLDEPTNHLDLEATLWLEDYLRTYPHSLLIVSHDRDLLNKAPTAIVHLDGMKLTSYTGNYDAFVRMRMERLRHAQAEAVKQEARRAHLQAFVDRFRAKASKASQAQSKLKALERLGPRIQMIDESPISFDFPTPDPLPPPLIRLDDASVGYGDTIILRRLSLRIDADDRIALLGANGNGKSTLAKLLAGRLAPMAGEAFRSAKLRVGYFAQHQAEEMQLDRTALETMQAAMPPSALEGQARAHLARFGLDQAKAETRVGDLSGGERAKLLLALTTRDAPHILILDEPTNHLDIDSREALAEALNDYGGAVLMISHDPHLLRLTADRLWLVDGGACLPFDGDLDDYKRFLLERSRTEARSAGKGGATAAGEIVGKGKEQRRDERRAAAELRASLAPWRRRVQELERQIEALSRRRAALEAQLADPAFYAGPTQRVAPMQIELGRLVEELTTSEEEWLDLSERLDAALAGDDGS
jgi:ATP-binding cassette, subfamily F, member 3